MPPGTEAPPPPPLPTLPFDLVAEIFCRLPVKLLLQLSCECKSWNSLISDPKFARKHLRYSPRDFTRHHLIVSHPGSSCDFLLSAYPLLSVFNAVVPASATPLKYPLHDSRNCRLWNIPQLIHFISESCNGIICLSAGYGSSIILNPFTQRFKILPSLEYPLRGDSFTTFGFGYHHFTDRYKVVAVFCYRCDSGRYRTQVKVYTLGTDSWREIQEFPSCVPRHAGRFVSGTLNWMVSESDGSNWFILSLDLGNECYQKLLPPPDSGSVVDPLGVLRDCLCILSGDYKVCHVWLMKEYGNQESWTKLFSVARELFPFGEGLRALHISEDDQLLVTFRSKLFLYNSRDNTLKTPQIQNITSCMVPWIYVESLISPCS